MPSGGGIDFAQLVKVYGASPEGPEARYSPAECIGTQKHAVTGCPDPKHVSTSYVERHNLTIRMGLRRYTRLTNAHSKKLRNHTAALGLFFCFYNFCRIHQSLRVTPAMAAGVTARVWSVVDLLALLPPVAEGQKRGRTRRRPSPPPWRRFQACAPARAVGAPVRATGALVGSGCLREGSGCPGAPTGLSGRPCPVCPHTEHAPETRRTARTRRAGRGSALWPTRQRPQVR
jgi:hypothetical protein